MSEIPRQRTSRRLIDVVGPLTEEQAARVLAVFNRRLLVQPQEQSVQTPDAA